MKAWLLRYLLRREQKIAAQAASARVAALCALPTLALLECTPRGEIVSASAHAAALLASPPDALVGSNCRDALGSADPAAVTAWDGLVKQRRAGYVEGVFGASSRRLRISLSPIAEAGFLAFVEDLSGVEASEQARRTSEARLSKVVELTPDLVMLSRLDDGRIVELNAAWERITGWPRAQSIGRTTTELGLWKDSDERRVAFCRFAAGEKMLSYSGPLHRRDGSVGSMEMKSWRISEDGEDLVLTVIHDSSETERVRKEANQAAAATARTMAMFLNAFEANPALACITRASDDKILQVNESFVQACGTAREGLIGHTAVELQVWAFPAERAQFLARLDAEHSVRAFPAHFMLLDGKLHTMQINAAQFGSEQGALRIIVASDISELVATRTQLSEAEGNFKAFFAMAPIPLAVTSLDGVFIAVNRAWCESFGWSEDEVIGRTSPEFSASNEHISREDRALLYAELHTQKGRVERLDIRVQRKDGSQAFVAMHAMPGKVGGQDVALWSLEDVTRLREAHQRINELNASLKVQVEESSRALKSAVVDLGKAHEELIRNGKLTALGALMATLTHELNTPIGNSVTAATTLQDRTAELLQAMESGQMRRSTLESFAQDAQEAAELTLRSLQHARELLASFKLVAADQISSRRRSFELESLIRDLLVTLSPGLRRSGQKIVSDIAPGLTMDSYPGALDQVLTNLIDNALQHGLDGIDGGTVTIAARPGSAGHLTLTVSDNGRGIAADLLQKIFEPFFTTREGRGGTGLGLHIVRSIVSAPLGGSIRAGNTEAGGACFTLELPLSPDDGDSGSSPSVEHP